MDAKNYSAEEERINFLTHAFGSILSIFGFINFFVVGYGKGNLKDFIGLLVFGISLFLLYFFSALYHFVKKPETKQFFRKLDHSAIFILIAGSYTPLMLMTLHPALGVSMIIICWILAAVGILSEFYPIFKSRKWAIVLYLVMGWMAVFVIKPIIESVSLLNLVLIVAGGVIYTLGVIFYVRRKMYHNHGIWHFFVLGGSICHYFAFLGIFING
ncbi:MAG: hypothetical protein A2X47_00635 [Lentisphaerae bacterium GWF2_38_69]|nr:MAG: hypothetical protein A2X47_00635 [Lentisphaerae bacterium GWF2_38_69]